MTKPLRRSRNSLRPPTILDYGGRVRNERRHRFHPIPPPWDHEILSAPPGAPVSDRPHQSSSLLRPPEGEALNRHPPPFLTRLQTLLRQLHPLRPLPQRPAKLRIFRHMLQEHLPLHLERIVALSWINLLPVR